MKVCLLSLILALACISNHKKLSKKKAIVVVEAAWSKKMLSVCWMREGFDFFKTMIKNQVAAEFHQKTAIRFEGWMKCDEKRPSDIRIDIVDKIIERGKTIGGQGLSNIGKGLATNAWIFHEHRINKPTMQLSTILFGEGYDATTYLGMTMHEFGHAVGLLHEDMHPKTDTSCRKFLLNSNMLAANLASTTERQIIKDGGTVTYLSPLWDGDSIMSYCQIENTTKSLRPSPLSPIDVEAIDYLYGKPNPILSDFRPELPKVDFSGSILHKVQKLMIRSGSYIFDCKYIDLFNGKFGISIEHDGVRYCGSSSKIIKTGHYRLPFIYSSLKDLEKI